MSVLTNQEIIANAPKDWTHYADGTYLQFAGVWLRYESGCPEITSCKEWVADIDIEDCENIRSRSDIERIVELEKYNLGLANESCEQQERIAELEKEIESYKRAKELDQ